MGGKDATFDFKLWKKLEVLRKVYMLGRQSLAKIHPSILSLCLSSSLSSYYYDCIEMGPHYIVQAGLKFPDSNDPPVSASQVLVHMVLYIYKILLCWGYIVAFTKILTVYQIYHGWIHLLHRSPLSPVRSHSWHNFNWSHFSIFIHVFTVRKPIL
jgi:hypothetical protein